MFVIPGIAAMLAFLYIRPQEVFDAWRPLTFSVVLTLATLGYTLDRGVGATRAPRASPLLVAAAAFFGWATLTVAVNAPDSVSESPLYFVAAAALFLSTSLGVQTLRGFGVVTKVLLMVTLLMVALAPVALMLNTTPLPEVSPLPSMVRRAPAAGTSEDVAMLMAHEKGADLIVSVGAHFNLIEFLDRKRGGMSSTFLTRLRIGEKLVDAKGVSRLYRPSSTLMPVIFFVVAFLVLVTILIITSPALNDVFELFWLKVRIWLGI